MGSQSARSLAVKLDCKRLKEKGKYKHWPSHLIINWGNSRIPSWYNISVARNMLNPVAVVQVAADKVSSFQLLERHSMGNHLPLWTTSKSVAQQWLPNPLYGPTALRAVVCRTLTHANSGRGIVLAKTPEEVVAAPLYTLYKPKTLEYRVHVSRQFGVIDIQQKRLRNGGADEEGYNKYIRSHRHGWVFCRDGLEVAPIVKEAAMDAIHHLNLDFGAVDIGYHPTHGLTIYEVNTAPGLEGQTLISYVEMFRKYLHG